MDEVRNVGQYEITDSFEIAGVEIVMGENLNELNHSQVSRHKKAQFGWREQIT